MQVLSQLPREPTRGLIEVAPVAKPATWLSPLPREPTRGLIEVFGDALLLLNRADFPENQLGASLKSELRTVPPRQLVHFPENQLGASLKFGGGRGGQAESGDFPENQLGASLKSAAR